MDSRSAHRLLFGGAAIAGAAAIAAAGPSGSLAGLATAVASGVGSNFLHQCGDELAKRLAGSPAYARDYLHDQDLRRLVGATVAARLNALASDPMLPAATRRRLPVLAIKAEEGWLALAAAGFDELQPLNEDGVTRLFAMSAASYAKVTALDANTWADFLDYLEIRVGDESIVASLTRLATQDARTIGSRPLDLQARLEVGAVVTQRITLDLAVAATQAFSNSDPAYAALQLRLMRDVMSDVRDILASATATASRVDDLFVRQTGVEEQLSALVEAVRGKAPELASAIPRTGALDARSVLHDIGVSHRQVVDALKGLSVLGKPTKDVPTVTEGLQALMDRAGVWAGNRPTPHTTKFDGGHHRFLEGIAEDIKALGEKYLKDEYVEREIDRLATAFLESSSPVFLVVDGAGTGKTSFCCHLALRAAAEREVIFIDCGSVGDLSEELTRRLSSTAYRAHEAGSRSVPLVFMDAINECDSLPEARRLVVRLLRGAATGRAKYVITCRDIAWTYFEADLSANPFAGVLYGGSALTTGHFQGSSTDQLFAKYLHRFCVKADIRDRARSALTQPLILRLFCEAYRNEVVGRITDLYLTDLFENYLRRKRTEIATRLQLAASHAVDEFLETFAGLLWDSPEQYPTTTALSALPSGGVDPRYGSLYALLLETQILVEKNAPATARRITFQYEAFQDFVTARMLQRRITRATHVDRPTAHMCAEYLRSEPARPTLETVAGFLFAMTRSNGSGDLINIAVQGPVWARAIVHALRQLPSSRIVASDLSLLVKLSSDDDPDTLRLAMDAVADRYAYLSDDLREEVCVWIDYAYPALSARIIVENFGRFQETNWSALLRLLARDRTEIARTTVLDFAVGHLRDGDTSQELQKVIEELSRSSDLQIARSARTLLDNSFRPLLGDRLCD